MLRTVRGKLVALVIACMAPAVVSAVLRTREAESTLLDQATRRVDRVNTAFAAEMAEEQGDTKLGLVLVDHAPRFQQALAAHNAADAERLVQILADVYKHSIILAVDAHGDLVAVGNGARGPASLHADVSPPFAELLAGKSLQGMLPFAFADGRGYAMVAAQPVMLESKQVGAVAIVSPLDAHYLDRMQEKVEADLALRVDGELVAASSKNPNPELQSHEERAVLQDGGGKLYALKTFKPEALQGAGHVATLTALRDVTELRDRSQALLLHSAVLLVPVLLIGLAIALVLARRIGRGVRTISDAAAQVKEGKYVMVPEPRERTSSVASRSTSTPWSRGSSNAIGCARRLADT